MSVEEIDLFFRRDDDNFAGWHVLIGDNGSGKTGILRAIAICLCGPGRFKSFRYNEKKVLRQGAEEGSIALRLIPGEQEVNQNGTNGTEQYLETKFWNSRDEQVGFGSKEGQNSKIWSGTYGWFSASFGPFRRLTGGNSQHNKLFDEDHRVAAHISTFESDIAFVQVDDWLKSLQFKKLEKEKEKGNTSDFIDRLIDFINQGELLPNGVKLIKITSEGVFFSSPDGKQVPLDWLSDGYRSVLSLMLELVRQMTIFFPAKTYGPVFKSDNDKLVVPFSGVVLIDEVDAHLHPTWQVRIGYWFTKYFPNIQFIVTTHSPLICRAAENGSVWRLATPGSMQESGRVEGNDLQRLIYGNVLDAYGTEVFGENISRSASAQGMLNELAKLNKKSMMGTIAESETIRLEKLRTILPTESL